MEASSSCEAALDVEKDDNARNEDIYHKVVNANLIILRYPCPQILNLQYLSGESGLAAVDNTTTTIYKYGKYP